MFSIPQAPPTPREDIMATGTLTPLQQSPVLLDDYPSLPCSESSRCGLFASGYEISTHVFPAAYPRCPSSPWSPPSYPATPAKSKQWAQETAEFIAARKENQELGHDTRPLNNSVVWSIANRISRTSRRDAKITGTRPGLTFILLHGIGAHKEVWPPSQMRSSYSVELWANVVPAILSDLGMYHQAVTRQS